MTGGSLRSILNQTPCGVLSVVSSSIRFTALLVLTVATACIAIWGTFRAAEDIEDRYQLGARGQVTKGAIYAHEELYSRGDCRRAALVKYSVDGQDYITKVFGCGTSPGIAPIGRTVEVRYLAHSPQVSKVLLPDTNDGRMGAGMLLASWAFMALVLAGVWSEYRKKSLLRGAK